MAGVIATNGISDSVLYAQVMAGLTKSYNQNGVGNGNYPNAQDILTDRGLYNVWMRNLLNARIYADGLGFTSRTAQAQGVSSVRIPIMKPPTYAPRTIALVPYPGMVMPGTPGNSGLENTELPEVIETDGVDITFNQLYDKATVIYQVSQNMLSLPLAAERTRLTPEAVANMEDSSLLATQLIGGLARAAATENSNIVPVNLASLTEGALQQAMNKLIGTMTNPQTSWSEGAVYYPLNECVIMMKQSFFDLLFSIKNGALLSASDLGQKMLIGGGFTEDGKMMGQLTRGIYSTVPVKVVPDSYWRQAAAYAQITTEQFPEFDKVQCFIANAEGTGFGRSSTIINPIPNPGNAVGTKIQTLFQWGAGVTRPSSIGMIVNTASNLSDFVNPIDENGRAVIAPKSFSDTIKSYGFNTDYGKGSQVGVYDSNKTTTVTLTVTGTASAKIANAALSIAKADGATVGYTNNADGTYTFVLSRGDSATVEVSAAGYEDATVSITSANTNAATYAASQSLTAAS